MGRSPCCSKESVNRGAWSAEEDEILINYIKTHGEGKWGNLPKRAGLKRCGKSCRLRWLNYLRPDIKRGNISPQEEDLIIRLHNLLGNRWSLIAGRLPGRTDNEIKNYWNRCLGKKTKAQSSSKTGIKEDIYSSQENKHSTETSVEVPGHEPHATRCTKVILPSQQGDPMGEKDMELGLPQIPSFPTQQEDHYLNFLMDSDLGALFLSDAIDSNYMQIFGDGGGCGDNSLSFSFYHHLAFSEEEVLHDWNEGNLI